MTYSDLQTIFVKLTFLLRGFDYDDVDSEYQKLIRLAYQSKSQPFQELENDISYIWVNYSDSSTNNQINEKKEYDVINDKVISRKYQLRNLDVHWTFYGEAAQDSGYNFRQMLFSEKAKSFLDTYYIKLIPTVPEVVLFYEEVNKRWWPRIDIIVKYYVEAEINEELDYFEKLDAVLTTPEKTIIIKED